MAKARLPGQISGEVIDMDFMAEYKHWLESGALSAEEHAELQSVADDKEEIESRFYAPLSFGTAGLRGVLGVGLNRMNRFTVGQAAQGLAKLIVSNGQEAMDRGVAIAYDSRHFSPEFAKQSACILAANGIKALIFDELRPTPELSFAVRHYGCIAGFAAEYGNADFRIGSTPEGSDLLLDSAVSRDEVPAGAEVLFDEEICIAVPDGHRFADCGAVSLTELADDPFIALSGSESFQQVSEHIFRSAGIAMYAAIECDSLALQSRLLSCGMGIALAAAGEWRQLCEEGSVHLLHIRDAECRRYIYVQQLSRFETHSMRAFRAFLRRYFSEIG